MERLILAASTPEVPMSLFPLHVSPWHHHSAVSGGGLPLARAGLARGFSPAQPSTLAPAPGGGGGNEGPGRPPAAARSVMSWSPASPPDIRTLAASCACSIQRSAADDYNRRSCIITEKAPTSIAHSVLIVRALVVAFSVIVKTDGHTRRRGRVAALPSE